MPDDQSTIVGEATPPGRGALRVLRLSGCSALDILRRLFVPLGEAPWEKPRALCLGELHTPGGALLDKGMAVYFRAPASFTGEEVAELHLHGSPGVIRAALDGAAELGARPALPGEFSYRAFLHGKMEILEAETVQALVEAEAEGQAAAVAEGFRGGVGRDLASARESLLDLLASWEARIDFPEDVGEEGLEAGKETLQRTQGSLARLAAAARGLRHLREGLRVALVGAVNTGKSSLFNALLKRERALVTPHPGTTRDVLEEAVQIAGFPVVLVDTAGVRESADPVEILGVSAGLRAAAEADGILFVYDLASGWRPEEEALFSRLPAPPLAVLGNKRDLAPEAPLREGALALSARTGEGLQALSGRLARWVEERAPRAGALLVTQRQCAQVRLALEGLGRSLGALQSGYTEEVAAEGLREAVAALDSVLTGGSREDLYDRIFSAFCIGK
jgi:tRNA modification GTPase